MVNLSELSRENFLCIADTTLDIKEKLEMSDEGHIWIPIIRNLIRFPELYPVHSIQQMDNYGDARSRALSYLKKHGFIENYEFIQEGGHRWYTKVKVTVLQDKFLEYYREFKKEYARRKIDFPIDEKYNEKPNELLPGHVNDSERKELVPYHLQETKSGYALEQLEIARNQEERWERNVRQRNERERLRLEMLAGKPQRVYAIEKIIEKTVYNPTTTELTLQFTNDLGYPDNVDFYNEADKFLADLTSKGCISNFARTGNGVYTISGSFLEPLRSYLANLAKELPNTGKVSDKHLYQMGESISNEEDNFVTEDFGQLGKIRYNPKSDVKIHSIRNKNYTLTRNKSKLQEIDYTDTSERKATKRKWDTLQTIWEAYKGASESDILFIPIERLTIKGRTAHEIDGILRGLKNKGAFGHWHRGRPNYEISKINAQSLANQYQETKNSYERFARQYQSQHPEVAPEKPREPSVPETFCVSAKDREIWINEYLLSKPFAVGSNKGFFDYIYDNAGRSLARNEMPDYAKEDLAGKRFSKVLNQLGFKGEILKAFFPERSKSQVLFRREVSSAKLRESGVNLKVLMLELLTAHARNSPK